MNQDTNKSIFEWLHPDGCWHEFAPLVDVCVKCTQPANGNPNYTDDPAAMVELIEAVRAKGYAVWMNNATGPWCVSYQPIGTVGAEGDFLADTLPAAVAQAVLKLIKTESEAIEAEARA